MASLKHIESTPIAAAVLAAHELAVSALGSDGFAAAATAAVAQLTHVDRFYVFDIPGGAGMLRPLIHVCEPEKPYVADGMYARQFLPRDPIQRAIDALEQPQATVQIRVAPCDIVADRYREMLEYSGIVERVSFVRRSTAGWRCMTVARRGNSGTFDDELELLGGFARLLMPMIERNEALAGHATLSTKAAIDELEGRFSRLFPALTPRERETCARAAIGMTAEGTALDLGIGVSSILTYRKRAYQRLGVTSAYELGRLVMR